MHSYKISENITRYSYKYMRRDDKLTIQSSQIVVFHKDNKINYRVLSTIHYIQYSLVSLRYCRKSNQFFIFNPIKIKQTPHRTLYTTKQSLRMTKFRTASPKALFTQLQSNHHPRTEHPTTKDPKNIRHNSLRTLCRNYNSLS